MGSHPSGIPLLFTLNTASGWLTVLTHKNTAPPHQRNCSLVNVPMVTVEGVDVFDG